MITKKADAFGTIKDITRYIFENDYEIQPGKWNFTIMHEGEKLIEKTFVVVKK